MDATRFTNVQVDGALKASGITAQGGNFSAVSGALIGAASISKAVDYTIDAEELASPALLVELTAASKAVTLGIANGQVMFVANVGGTNAFTLKGQSGDSGTSLSAGKVAVVFGSKTANATKIYVLN